MIRLFFVLACALPAALAQTNLPRFFPVAVWYGGGKARAPMLESGARATKDLWRKDLQTIRSLGFNTVRAWIDWSTGEPAPGRRNFETLDVITELAEEVGLKVLVQVYMDSAPAWLGRRYPDALFVSSNGAAVKPESSPGYCLDHPGIRAADLAFYEALGRHLSRSPAFLGFDLWSEPHVINWANPTYIQNPEFCFCPNTLRRYRSWLKKKYATLEALNAAWYRQYQTWEEVEPNRMSTILSYTDYIDWKTFIAGKLGEDLHDRFGAAKRGAPDRFATSHAAGVGLFSSPHYWEGQSDDWTMARQVDYYGTSFYPKHSAGVDRDVQWRGALLDFARSFGYSGTNRGFWIGELQGGFGTIAVNVSPTVTPEDVRIWTWSAIARGAKGINYYAWYPMSTGYEAGGFGLIHLDGRMTERARDAGDIARVISRNQELFLNARPPKAEVAIVYNPLSHFVGGRQRAAAYGGPQGEVAGIERDSLLGVHRALFDVNLPIDFVHAEELTAASLKQYRLVLLVYPVMLPSRTAGELRRYVESGGALYAEARAGWQNERAAASETIPGMGLHEVLGCRETDVQTVARGRTVLRLENLAATLAGRWFEETLEPIGESARPVATFADGRIAGVESRFGKGRTMTMGSFLSAAYATTPEPAAQRFFRSLLEWAGVKTPAPTPLEMRWLESGDERIVFLFNHGTKPASAEVTGRDVTDLRSGEPLRLSRNRISVSVEPGQVVVLRVRPL